MLDEFPNLKYYRKIGVVDECVVGRLDARRRHDLETTQLLEQLPMSVNG